MATSVAGSREKKALVTRAYQDFHRPLRVTQDAEELYFWGWIYHKASTYWTGGIYAAEFEYWITNDRNPTHPLARYRKLG